MFIKVVLAFQFPLKHRAYKNDIGELNLTNSFCTICYEAFASSFNILLCGNLSWIRIDLKLTLHTDLVRFRRYRAGWLAVSFGFQPVNVNAGNFWPSTLYCQLDRRRWATIPCCSDRMHSILFFFVHMVFTRICVFRSSFRHILVALQNEAPK